MANIQKRIGKDGSTSYRVQVRIKGFPPQIATFKRKTDADRWAQSTEAAIRERRYFKTTESRKHNVKDMIERYIERTEAHNPKRIKDVRTILNWWKGELGYCLLSDLNRATISEKIEKLTNKKVGRRNPDTGKKEQVNISPATVNRCPSSNDLRQLVGLRSFDDGQ